MYIVICILLWLGAINPNNAYTTSDIQLLETQYAPIISVVESLPFLELQIEAQEGPEALIITNELDGSTSK